MPTIKTNALRWKTARRRREAYRRSRFLGALFLAASGEKIPRRPQFQNAARQFAPSIAAFQARRRRILVGANRIGLPRIGQVGERWRHCLVLDWSPFRLRPTSTAATRLIAKIPPSRTAESRRTQFGRRAFCRPRAAFSPSKNHNPRADALHRHKDSKINAENGGRR